MIADQEKQMIKALVTDPKWGAVQHVADELCQTIEGESLTGETEWDWTRNTLLGLGQASGIRRFLQRLFLLAHEQN